MKRALAQVGSVTLWADVAKVNSQPKLELWMESTLAGQPRQIGCTLTFDDLEEFKRRTKTLLKELEK